MANENEKMNPVDMILDENIWDDVYLYDEDEKAVAFEQIAVIPYMDSVYAILHPKGVEGVGEDEAYVFEIKDIDGDEPYLVLVQDEKIAEAVFKLYDELDDEE